MPASERRQARARRFSNAFRTFGGDGTQNVTHQFTNQGYQVVAQTGSGTEPIIEVLDLDDNVIAAVDDLGSAAPVRNDTVLNSNTTLNTTQLNQVISIEPGAALKITLPPNTDLRSGTWISFQDVSGSALTNNIIVDPNFASSGFELNGGAGTVVLVNTNYGIGTVRLVQDSAGNTNWFTEQTGAVSPGQESGGNVILTTANTVITTADIMFVGNNDAANQQAWLPSAASYGEGRVFYIKKILGAGTALTINIANGSGDSFDNGGTTTLIMNGTAGRYTIVSDGSGEWYITNFFKA